MAEGGTNVGSIVGDLSIKVGEALSRLDQVIARLDKLEAANTRTSRKTVSETDKAKAAYNKLAASLDPVIAKNQRYEKAQETLNQALKLGVINQAQYNRTLDQAKGRLETTTHWTQRLGNEIGSSLKSQITSLINPATLATAGIAALGAVTVKIFKDIVTASIDAERTANKVSSAIERYGQRAGLTVTDVNRLADAQSRLTGADDELIAESIVLGLRFNRLSGDEIPRLIRVAQDMAQVTGLELPAAMQKAGAYVNLPQQALTKLRKEGYAVLDSQDEMVKGLLRAGDVAGAQAVIFGILEEQYGGAAEAARDTLGGAFTALGTTWENFLEKVGEDRLGPLRGGVEQLITLIETLTGKINNFTIAWYGATVAIDKVLIGLTKLQIGAAEGPVARFLNPKGAAESAKKQRESLAGLEKELKEADRRFAGAVVQGLGFGSVLDKLSGIQRKTTTTTDELTDSEDKLNDKLRAQTEALDKLLDKQEEELRYLRERSAISSLSPGTDQQYIYEQLQKINDEHEYRLNLLAKIEQFGPRIGKQLADVDRDLKKFSKEIDLKFKLQFIQPTGQIERLRSGVIDLFGGVQQGIDQGMNNLLNHLRDLSLEQGADILGGGDGNVDPVVQANRKMFAELEIAHEEFWQDYSREVREGWKTNIDIIKDEMRKVEAAYETGIEGALTAAEKERELARLRLDLLNAELDQIATFAQGWQQFFSIVGSMFGGFAAKAASVLQQMISTFQAVQSAGNAISSLGGAAGQLGGALAGGAAFFAIAGAIISLQRESAARDRARQYTSSTSIGFETNGQFEVAGRRGRELANALESTLTPIMELIDRTLASLPEIEIHAREDGRGFAAHINDVFLGYFATLEDAIDAAVIASLQQIGPSLSETMRTVLANTTATTSEELQRDLETGLQFENLGLDDLAIRLKEMFADFRSMMRSVEELGLDSGKVQEQFSEDLEKFKNDFLGIDTSAADALARLVDVNRILTEQTQRMRQQSEERLATLRAEYEAMASGPRTFVSEDGRRSHTESQEEWERVRRDLEREIDLTLTEIEKLPQGLSDVEIHMSTFQALFDIIKSSDKLRAKYGEEAMKYAKIEAEAKIKALELQLRVLGLWDQFAHMFEDVANFLRETAGEDLKPRRGGGGRADAREGVLDFLRGREISLMGDLSGQLASLTDEYKEEIKAAGKNKDLIAQLTEMRQREISVLRDQTRAELITPYLGGVNAGSRSDFDRQRIDLNRAYDDYRNNARALGEAIWRINAAEKERLRLLGLEASAAAGSRTAATVLEFQNLGQTISFLRDHAEELGISFSTLMDELQGEQLVAFGDRILSFLDKYYGETAGFEQFRMDLEQTRFELELANIQLQFTLLEDLGLLTDKTISRVEGIFDFIDTHPIDWDKFIRGGNGAGGGGDDNVLRFKGYDDAATSFSSSVDDVEDNLNRLAEAFKQAKESIRDTLDSINRGDFGIVSPQEAFNAAQKQYQDVVASANRGELVGFEETSEATRNYIEALKRFSPALAAVELPNIKGNLSLLANATTVRSDNLIYTEKFAQGQETGNRLLAAGFTDLSNSLHTQNGLQSQVVVKLDRIASSQEDLNARLARLESGQVAQKR